MELEVLRYKGYYGSICWNDKDEVFHGKIIDTKDLITYKSRTLQDLYHAFTLAVDDYLNLSLAR